MELLLIVLILLLVFGAVGAAPNWRWHNYGYYPSGAVGLVLLVLLLVLLFRAAGVRL